MLTWISINLAIQPTIFRESQKVGKNFRQSKPEQLHTPAKNAFTKDSILQMNILKLKSNGVDFDIFHSATRLTTSIGSQTQTK